MPDKPTAPIIEGVFTHESLERLLPAITSEVLLRLIDEPLPSIFAERED